MSRYHDVVMHGGKGVVFATSWCSQGGKNMLVLSRKVGESLVLDREIKLTVLRVGTTRIRIGIEAPEHVSVLRGELVERSVLPLGNSQAGEAETQPA
jgi:carbon storage regulator